MSTTATRRPYDATRRRQRAEVEREETRRKVIAAAHDLFVERGYVDTTVEAIAARAGVVKQTVYLAAGSKPQLLRAVEKAVASNVADPAVETDPRQQLRSIATHIRTVAESSAPVLKAMREAAAVDPEMAAYAMRAAQLRHADYANYARLLPVGALRHEVAVADVIDTLWALASPEMIELLVGQRAWTFDRLEQWLDDSLARLLLAAA